MVGIEPTNRSNKLFTTLHRAGEQNRTVNRSNKLFTTLHRAGEQNRTVILCLEGRRTNRCATPAKITIEKL